jgi:DNA-directed RNA polymerase specialized sigma24 family protein
MVLTWINTIALNLYRGLIRREAAATLLPTEFRDSTSIDLVAIDMSRILEFCRPSDRLLLEQHLSGVTAKEIAATHGVTETAIRIRFLRARRTARAIINHRAPTCSLPAANAA